MLHSTLDLVEFHITMCASFSELKKVTFFLSPVLEVKRSSSSPFWFELATMLALTVSSIATVRDTEGYIEVRAIFVQFLKGLPLNALRMYTGSLTLSAM